MTRERIKEKKTKGCSTKEREARNVGGTRTRVRWTSEGALRMPPG